MDACECHSSLHPSDGCGKPAIKRWEIQPEHVYKNEPGHIALCRECLMEWAWHGLEPAEITPCL